MKHSAILQTITDRVGINYSRYKNLNPACRQVAGLTIAVTKLEELALNKNPIETEAAHAKRVAAAASKVKSMTEQTQQQITETVTEAKSELQEIIASKSRLIPTEDAAEIRLALRELNSKQRKKVLFDATNNGDAVILAALDQSNYLTTGIADDLKVRFLDQYRGSQAPAEFEELKALEGMVEAVPVAITTAFKASEDAFDPSCIKQLQLDENKAAEAQKTFDESVTA